jgi:D-alanyl-D-alanine carboxypeptidase
MTSGLPEYWGSPGFSHRKDYTQAELIALAGGVGPPNFRPGERWEYSNTNYLLLGMLIDSRCGDSYGEFMGKRIFQPLGMASTPVNDTLAVVPRRSTGYERGFGLWTLRDFISPTLVATADGSLLSTASDLARWDRAWSDGSLLKESSRKLTFTPATLVDGKTAGYGFGWHLGTVGGHRAAWHSGGNPGYECHMVRFVDDRLTVIVLCNLFPASTQRLARVVADLYLPGIAETKELPINDEDPETTRTLRAALASSLDGTREPNLFDREQRAKLRSFGPVNGFELLGRKPREAHLTHRYRVTFGDTMMIFSL